MPFFSFTTNISYRKSFYTLAVILLTILFLYFLNVALYYCPRSHYGYKGERKKKIKPEAPQEASQQFRVTDPISMADLENIHTRRGKYPSQPPPFGPKTWEMAQKEKEERVLREKRERPLNTPLGTTSTDAMDTEEVQEFSKKLQKRPWKENSKSKNMNNTNR